MNRTDIIRITNQFLSEEFEISEEKLQPEALLKNDLKIDSLDFVDIAVEVENQFHFKVTPDEMKQVSTLGEFYDMIEKRQA